MNEVYEALLAVAAWFLNAWLPQASYPCGTIALSVFSINTESDYILGCEWPSPKTYLHLVCELHQN